MTKAILCVCAIAFGSSAVNASAARNSNISYQSLDSEEIESNFNNTHFSGSANIRCSFSFDFTSDFCLKCPGAGCQAGTCPSKIKYKLKCKDEATSNAGSTQGQWGYSANSAQGNAGTTGTIAYCFRFANNVKDCLKGFLKDNLTIHVVEGRNGITITSSVPDQNRPPAKILLKAPTGSNR